MAYFSNSTEGEVLDRQCGYCVIPNDAPCPILLIQMNFNYRQLDDKGEPNMVAEVMNCLVTEQGECLMKRILDDMPNPT